MFFVATKLKNMAVCSTVLPPTSSDICDVNSNYGELNQLYFTRFGDSLTDWEDDTEWATRLSNSTAMPALPTLAPIRSLFGIGSVSAPERPTIPAPRKGTIYGIPVYTIIFNVYDTSATNMTMVSLLPTSGQTYAAWIGTEEKLFGGNDGIKMTMIADPIIPESKDDVIKIQVTLTFEGAFPEMTDNFLS